MATIAAARNATSPSQTSGVDSGSASSPLPRNRQVPRPPSYAHNRLSQISSSSRRSKSGSRPTSQAILQYQSSLDYTLVRDYGYPVTHPMFPGPPPESSKPNSQISSPVSEHGEILDDSIPWDYARGNKPSEQFEGPWSEDEDLQSPVVIQTRRRGRGNGSKKRHAADRVNVRGYGPDVPSHLRSGVSETADSIDTNLMTPSQPRRADYDQGHYMAADDDDSVGSGDERDENRYSRDYQFTIASPDEEMHGKAVALFNFHSENENELALTEGQIVLVSYRHEQGWLVAEDPTTRESGLVPEEYVRLLRDIKGGLSGLHNEDEDDSGDEMEGGSTGDEGSRRPSREDIVTPTQADHAGGGAFAQIRGIQETAHPGDPPKSSGSGSGYQATVSTFSTSSRDLEDHQHLLGAKQGSQPPPQRAQHRDNNQTLPATAADSPSKSKTARSES